jgi:ribosomal RNA-processing protein 1
MYLLQPFITLLARTRTPQQYTRLQTTLFQPLLTSLSTASPSLTPLEPPTKRAKVVTDTPMYAHLMMGCCVGQKGVEGRVKPDELRRELLKRLFDAGSDVAATESGRRKIYALWREEGGDDDEDED